MHDCMQPRPHVASCAASAAPPTFGLVPLAAVRVTWPRKWRGLQLDSTTLAVVDVPLVQIADGKNGGESSTGRGNWTACYQIEVQRTVNCKCCPTLLYMRHPKSRPCILV